ncbi:MAG TPA: hypothetical protein VHD90_25035 [Phototrophicaceae bacterium]|nr:hypothetical protein [Phototrophicaceae bacterium]
MIRQLQFGLIGIAALVFAVLFVGSQEYVTAGAALVFGVIWIVLEVRLWNPLRTVLMIAFVGLAAANALEQASNSLILLGLIAALAAWDLSRFWPRIQEEEAGAAKTRLERAHLQKLALVSGGGFVVALIPLAIQISIQFVGLCLIALIAAVLLRAGIGSLRGEPKPEG